MIDYYVSLIEIGLSFMFFAKLCMVLGLPVWLESAPYLLWVWVK